MGLGAVLKMSGKAISRPDSNRFPQTRENFSAPTIPVFLDF